MVKTVLIFLLLCFIGCKFNKPSDYPPKTYKNTGVLITGNLDFELLDAPDSIVKNDNNFTVIIRETTTINYSERTILVKIIKPNEECKMKTGKYASFYIHRESDGALIGFINWETGVEE